MYPTKHHESLNVLHENVLAPRAYYVPASHDMGPLVNNRESSDRFLNLNGTWQFTYFNDDSELPQDFHTAAYAHTDASPIIVPGAWQTQGFDTHQYTNFKYPFPLDPPFVPHENPCGLYTLDFQYTQDQQAPLAHLTFEGVDSCFYLWVNGSYIGYSQVSHASSEFDITEYLTNGSNRLTVLVYKWCDGSYLEDQDKFRMSGIFRDVYILSRPRHALYDYFITTNLNEKTSDATLNIAAHFLSQETHTTLTLTNAEGEEVASSTLTPSAANPNFTHSATLHIPNAHTWNPENPYLYTLHLKTQDEVITERVGVRTIRIEHNVILLNGKPITFRGVNRHDSDPVTGPTVDYNHIKRDLGLIKQHNFNAIRSSHYPNSPYFYQMCDEYGFLVMSEADNESHGTQVQYLEDGSFDNQVNHWNERISDNPEWTEATLDRVQLCVLREKNRPSIVSWSAGNECGYGVTLEKSLAWVKSYDTTRITQYESAYYDDKKRRYDYSNIDLYSRMYPPFEDIEQYLNSNPNKPFLLVEYAHAMGNGPGNLEDYFQVIDQNQAMCGGFVWEWCDHAIYAGTTENGTPKYLYGGDHGEEVHDGNFCMDGLVYPDRTPHVGLLEYRNVYRPLRVVSFDTVSGSLTLKNYLDFTDAQEAIELKYTFSQDGVEVASGTYHFEQAFLPHQETTINLEAPSLTSGRCYLHIEYILKKDLPLLPTGLFLGRDEVPVHTINPTHAKALDILGTTNNAQNLAVTETGKHYTVQGDGFTYTFNRRTGVFDQLSTKDHNLLTQPMNINIWRAPTDNDMYIKLKWAEAHYHQAYSRVYTSGYTHTENGVTISCTLSMVAPTVQPIFTGTVLWNITNDGKITARFNIERAPEFPDLPRFGVRLFLDKSFADVEYFGMGPHESYSDKHEASYHGTFQSSVEDLHEDYIMPQENGSRFDCDYVHLSSPHHQLSVASEHPFSFSASHYTQEELTNKNHNFELVEADSTVLCLDYAHNGIGSNSCGPEVLDEYKLNAQNINFGFTLAPTL